MGAESAAPCRHVGAPPDSIIDKVRRVILSLGEDTSYLAGRGLSAEEYSAALPVAIEMLRGSQSASNTQRRRFLEGIFDAMRERRLISNVAVPVYGDDTVYRVTIPDFGDVAVIQKGCPDGAHSSVRWSAPEWARETYLWWLCSSLTAEPGAHLVKGVNRLRQRFFSSAPDTLDGVLFHNELCGTSHRPCPKLQNAVEIGGTLTPPPCIYVMPDREVHALEWNWNGEQRRRFPAILMSLFGISEKAAPNYVGYVGFQRKAGRLKTTIVSRFGPARSTSFRN
jgi:hypothetical protein